MTTNWRSNLIFVVGGLLVLITLPVAAFLQGRSLPVDPFMTNLLHSLSAPWLTAVMKVVSTYAYHSIHWWIIGAVGAYFLIRRRSIWEALALIVVRYGSDFAQEQIKTFYARPRPVLDWVKPSSSFSYPSGTVTVGAALCIALGYLLASELSTPRLKKAAVASGWALAGLIAASRIYLGAHWFTDTVGALALASMVVGLGLLPIAMRTRKNETVPVPSLEPPVHLVAAALDSKARPD